MLRRLFFFLFILLTGLAKTMAQGPGSTYGAWTADSLGFIISGDALATPVLQTEGMASFDVGSVSTTFAVNAMGAATYNVNIEAPDGGTLMPQIALSYNSQAGMGLAGYGFSIAGLSCISRGRCDLLHDGESQGVAFSRNDAFYLDGIRLLTDGSPNGTDGSMYHPEGDPYTQVTLHGNADEADCWFEVQGRDGLRSEYGRTNPSRLSWTGRTGTARTTAWNITRRENAHGDYMAFTYVRTGLTVRPLFIDNGRNAKRNRGLANRIQFFYTLVNPSRSIPISLADQRDTLSVRLRGIVSSTAGKTYRRYTLTYDETSDGGERQYARLTRINVENGEGARLRPISIAWNALPSFQPTATVINVPTTSTLAGVEDLSRTFFTADVNNDGIPDILRLSPVSVTGTAGQTTLDTYLYVSLSLVSGDGKVTYLPPTAYPLGATFSDAHCANIIGAIRTTDFDGDGLNDIALPAYLKTGEKECVQICVLLGRDLSRRRRNIIHTALPLQSAHEAPLFATADLNDDGLDEMLLVENAAIDRHYAASLIGFGSDGLSHTCRLSLSLPSAPKQLFMADMNGDGLTDIILLHDGGYKVYFNQGGRQTAGLFSESATHAGTEIGESFRVVQADFDGDGRQDFLVYVKDNDYHLALNNGNGGFSVLKNVAAPENIFNQSTSKDDQRFTLLPYDFDHDGLTDLVAVRAGYKHHGFPHFSNDYEGTYVHWLSFDGEKFTSVHSQTTTVEADADAGQVFLGDFDGDGAIELANCGSNLLTGANSSTAQLHLYHIGGNAAVEGRIARISGPLGNTTDIVYAPLTRPSVYSHQCNGAYPAPEYTLPLSVVSSTTQSDGAAGTQTKDYRYSGLRIHLQGKGILGFSRSSVYDATLDQTTEQTTLACDTVHWVPSRTVLRTTLGTDTATTQTDFSITSIGTCNYFSFAQRTLTTDLDGFTAETTQTYDLSHGVPLTQRVNNDGGQMYRETMYAGYAQKGGQWLPTVLERRQKHADDTAVFADRTVFEYDSCGNITALTEHAGSTLPLTTRRTYDTYGNVLTSRVSGKGVEENTTMREYDRTGRFVVRTSETASPETHSYEYDQWGYLLSEHDTTNPDTTLTTLHSYDGWGNLTASTDIFGSTATHERGWGDGLRQAFFVKDMPERGPWKKTWYDASGRTVATESIGVNAVSLSQTIDYDRAGRVICTLTRKGRYEQTDSTQYDKRGRILSAWSSIGMSAVYAYDGRTTTKVTAGHTTTQTVDAWGNFLAADGPSGNIVYRYASCGKPAEVTACGATTRLTYDDTGSRVAIEDADAGKLTYTYAANGRLLSTTDGRGQKTQYTYDARGRLIRKQADGSAVSHTYGTPGSATNRLIRSESNGHSIAYTYDNLGRIMKETRVVEGITDLSPTISVDPLPSTGGIGLEKNGEPVETVPSTDDLFRPSLPKRSSFTIRYVYDRDRLAQTIWPDGCTVRYEYDAYGNRTATYADSITMSRLTGYDGLTGQTAFAQRLTTLRTRNRQGRLSSIALIQGGGVLDQTDYTYDPSTDNLSSRQRLGRSKETFAYDAADRLLSVSTGGKQSMEMDYATNGNILSKTGIGSYDYASSAHPHAVTSVGNEAGFVPHATLRTHYDVWNRPDTISDDSTRVSLSISYGPDGQRWLSTWERDGRQVGYTIHMGNYEIVLDSMGRRTFLYLDDGGIVFGKGTQRHYYHAFTDNLGSTLSIVDKDGHRVFEADYDVWGLQEKTLDSLGLSRGYCGHEHYDSFALINMNGRLYDPLIGRFLSPDNQVQLPADAQNFNRYSYCLNNPLKYVDPSGESIEALLWFAAQGAFFGAMQAGMNDQPLWRGALSGVSYSLASYGVGALFGGIGSVGHELLRAGAHGLAGGVISSISGGDFVSSFVSGAASSGLGSYAQGIDMSSRMKIASTTAIGGMVAWATGGSFLQGALQGLMVGAMNHIQHDQYDPFKKQILGSKIPSKERMKRDSKYKQKIIEEIEADGVLTFEEAYYWYGYGDGSDIHVDASKLNLGHIDTTGKVAGDQWTVPTLSLKGNFKTGLVYGTVRVTYKGNNTFSVDPDEYDFDIHTDNFFNLHTIKRNFETIGAAILHGFGTPFTIIFDGLYYNKL